MAKTKLTILNSMAGREFESALDQHGTWGLTVLDLKDAIFGKIVSELTIDEAKRAAGQIRERELSVYCLSTGFFGGRIESGESQFRDNYLDQLAHLIQIADILQPEFVRLLAAQTTQRNDIADSVAYLRSDFPWLIPLYVEAIERLHEAGYRVTIENEVGGCLLSTPEEILAFFDVLDCRDKVCLTWDVQNLWQMGGQPPTVDIYHQLKPLIGYLHLKGGMADASSPHLRWCSSLEDASWPIAEITRRAVSDRLSPVICLNPSHGTAKEGYNYHNIVKRDLDFIRQNIPEVE